MDERGAVSAAVSAAHSEAGSRAGAQPLSETDTDRAEPKLCPATTQESTEGRSAGDRLSEAGHPLPPGLTSSSSIRTPEMVSFDGGIEVEPVAGGGVFLLATRETFTPAIRMTPPPTPFRTRSCRCRTCRPKPCGDSSVPGALFSRKREISLTCAAATRPGRSRSSASAPEIRRGRKYRP